MPMSVVDRIIVPMQQMPSLRTKKEGRWEQEWERISPRLVEGRICTSPHP
jgi:hypothetical protein